MKLTNKAKKSFLAGFAVSAILTLGSQKAMAHHGGASADFGPGSPVETTAPLTLPEGMFLLYDRFELVPFRKFSDKEPENTSKYTFNTTMLGYGIKDNLSAYVMLPYAEKKLDSIGTSRGFGDISLMFQYGFKYGTRNGIKDWYTYGKEDVAGADYTLDDYKFTLFGGMSIPTGTTSNRGNDMDGDGEGDILPLGNQPGFAVPSYNFGIAAAKVLVPHFTLTADANMCVFSQANEGRPGNEFRFNLAGGYEIYEQKEGFLTRVDLIGEANYLHLDKDMDGDRVTDDATGGHILYLSPAMRLTFFNKLSIGMMVKIPAWNELNKEADQQGGEGLEKYRFITTASIAF